MISIKEGTPEWKGKMLLITWVIEHKVMKIKASNIGQFLARF
jgi:hypothetical protein